jgi:hypothetical protein
MQEEKKDGKRPETGSGLRWTQNRNRAAMGAAERGEEAGRSVGTGQRRGKGVGVGGWDVYIVGQGQAVRRAEPMGQTGVAAAMRAQCELIGSSVNLVWAGLSERRARANLVGADVKVSDAAVNVESTVNVVGTT